MLRSIFYIFENLHSIKVTPGGRIILREKLTLENVWGDKKVVLVKAKCKRDVNHEDSTG